MPAGAAAFFAGDRVGLAAGARLSWQQLNSKAAKWLSEQLRDSQGNSNSHTSDCFRAGHCTSAAADAKTLTEYGPLGCPAMSDRALLLPSQNRSDTQNCLAAPLSPTSHMKQPSQPERPHRGWPTGATCLLLRMHQPRFSGRRARPGANTTCTRSLQGLMHGGFCVNAQKCISPVHQAVGYPRAAPTCTSSSQGLAHRGFSLLLRMRMDAPVS